MSGTGNLVKTERIVKKEGNVKTFKENFNQPVEKLLPENQSEREFT